MALAAGLTGALLGSFPGMAIGGLVGLIRKRSLPIAQDAIPEQLGVVLRAVVAPLVGGIGLIASYFLIFNPWLAALLG